MSAGASEGAGAGDLRFFFDFLSPYAYLAWTRIHAVTAPHGRRVVPVPVLFAGLLEAHGTRGPAEVDAKRRYLVQDIQRIAHAWRVPIAAPHAIPFRSLTALRLATLPLGPEVQRALIDRIYAGAWARGEDVTDRELLARIAVEVGAGDDALERAEAPEIKEALRGATERAVAEHVFGVPTMLVDGEMFWGCDAVPHLERFLAGERAIDPETMRAFAKVPVGARRRGS